MKRCALPLAICAVSLATALHAPAAFADVELAGRKVVVYGKAHVSYDLFDRGAESAEVTDPRGRELVSNSSRLGFKGEIPINDALMAIWQLESEIDVAGEVGELSARNRYAGLSGNWGRVLFGIHDTPLKDVGGDYTMFGDTVGDRRGILGQSSSGANVFNQRARNTLMYSLDLKPVSFSVMLADDFEDEADPDGSDNRLVSVGLNYKSRGFEAGLAWEKQTGIGGTAGADASALRVGALYGSGAFEIGAIAERLSDDGFNARIARNAFGINGAYKITESIKLRVQYLVASKSDAGNDGAESFALGAFWKLDKAVEVYAMFAALDNDSNASYRLARSGHGQSYAPTSAGEGLGAFSIGLSISF